MSRYIQSVEDVATGAVKKTLIQVATPANRRLIVVEWGISFNGSAAATPIKVQLKRQTTAGTSTAGTIVKANPADVAAMCTTGITFTAEPADSDILRTFYISPTSGAVFQYPLGREPGLAISSFLGLCVTAPASVNADAYIEWEEI